MARITLKSAVFLIIPPLMWAANAVVGRLARDLVPPMTFNALRWLVAAALLLPCAAWVLRRESGLWQHGRRFALLGFLGVGCYNALQYLALQTSTPMNVTLVASSGPFWTLLLGAVFFQTPVTRYGVFSAVLSLCGVLTVLSRGDWSHLRDVHLVTGDLFMLLASASWSWYSWLLTQRNEPAAIRADWAAFLLGQVVFGLGWCSLMTGAEWAYLPHPSIQWGWPLAGILLFVGVGPAVLAYRYWGLGIAQVGPQIAIIFASLTPLFAALMSSAFLGEQPHLYHAVAFSLMLSGILVSLKQARPK